MYFHEIQLIPLESQIFHVNYMQCLNHKGIISLIDDLFSLGAHIFSPSNQMVEFLGLLTMTWKAALAIIHLALNVENSTLGRIPSSSSMFVRIPPHEQIRPCLLSPALDWQLRVHLGRQLEFPEHITRTSLRSDMVTYSDATKHLVMWELVVPWDELVEECRLAGLLRCHWGGLWGVFSHSLYKDLTVLGVTREGKGGTINSITAGVQAGTGLDL